MEVGSFDASFPQIFRDVTLTSKNECQYPYLRSYQVSVAFQDEAVISGRIIFLPTDSGFSHPILQLLLL